ncbi:LytR/AlgR family response regulator transcription factor [Flavilitoribacter nigricans]|uniref:DNA-binding response regulator n=1 Tax=Flavilitoribacter nigricans (strain ATCC 23147 / DSM 23189 / NBRC 102662 / NCIMB 1420 / SS-2) TaxID=1122177 RepID=A0A2D0NDP9_FLAN2|nr:LytTR family DNA-binding domain-containing protein [Flavilitoribacter nigricans]PHN06500.1 DNA-binding response regulator [Flavilitoribacter nigricans DSM 23189 = NBRC 102662]
MVKAIIVEDEANNRENLRLALASYCPEVEVIGEADSALTALDLIRNTSPELVFLDIAMPLGSGFDLLESLPEIRFDIIFVTAYDQYALRAIKFAAVDYLLKPINVLELKKAVGRVLVKRENTKENERLAVLLHNLQKQDQKIALPQSDHIAFVPVNSIIRCRGDRNYTHFYFKDGTTLLVSRTLKEFTDLLEGNQFYRVHQSHLVNLDCIRKYSKRDGGTLITTDNEKIPVARARKDQLLAICRERWGMS